MTKIFAHYNSCRLFTDKVPCIGKNSRPLFIRLGFYSFASNFNRKQIWTNLSAEISQRPNISHFRPITLYWLVTSQPTPVSKTCVFYFISFNLILLLSPYFLGAGVIIVVIEALYYKHKGWWRKDKRMVVQRSATVWQEKVSISISMFHGKIV